MKKNGESDSIKDSVHPVKTTVDWFIFNSAALLLVSLVIAILSFPESSNLVIGQFYFFVTTSAGALYVFAAISVLTFLLWLAFITYGSI